MARDKLVDPVPILTTGRSKARKLPWQRKLLFSVFATISFFVGVELLLTACGLRPATEVRDPFVGFSNAIPLLEQERNERGEPIMVIRPSKLVWFNPQSFPVAKPVGTRRVFCMGGSTTFGRPYSDSTSFCGWLREFLPTVDPSCQWEVINAGGVSYASYRVAAVMEELSIYDPDLFIVYSVHNEFLEQRTYAAMLERTSTSMALQAAISRGRGSIEFKHCNVSAAFKAFGLPQIDGYKPRFNFQASLEEAVSRWLARHPDWFIEARNPAYSMQETPALSFSVAPTLQNSEPPEETAQMQRVAVKFDVVGRDARNRVLGKAGEARVFHHERSDLMVRGLEHLARRVRWVAEEDGDGLGYDILSFSPEGKERLIEVKTTTGWERTPFHMTINEVEVSRERQDAWRLYRLYDFARAPKAFELRPPLEAHVALMATTFQASFPRKSR